MTQLVDNPSDQGLLLYKLNSQQLVITLMNIPILLDDMIYSRNIKQILQHNSSRKIKMDMILKRLIEIHESSNKDKKLSHKIIIKMFKHNFSNQIATQMTLNKFRRKLSKNYERSVNRESQDDDEGKKLCFYSYYYHLINSLIQSNIFQSYKYRIVPFLLLIYWSWRQCRILKGFRSERIVEQYR